MAGHGRSVPCNRSIAAATLGGSHLDARNGANEKKEVDLEEEALSRNSLNPRGDQSLDLQDTSLDPFAFVPLNVAHGRRPF